MNEYNIFFWSYERLNNLSFATIPSLAVTIISGRKVSITSIECLVRTMTMSWSRDINNPD